MDHRLIVDGQQLLTDDLGEWVQASACTASQDNAFLDHDSSIRHRSFLWALCLSVVNSFPETIALNIKDHHVSISCCVNQVLDCP